MNDGYEGVRDAFGFLHKAEWHALKALLALVPDKGTAVNIGAGASDNRILWQNRVPASSRLMSSKQGPAGRSDYA